MQSPMSVLDTRMAHLMARLRIENFGITMPEGDFRELLLVLYERHYHNLTGRDELLVRPREAMRYCDRIRDELFDRGEDQAIDLPDDVILRTLLNIMKQG